MRTPEDVVAYGDEVAAVLGELLGDGLEGVYFVGSVALGGYVPGQSDIDIVAVSIGALGHAAKPLVAEVVFETTTRCPARGLEFTLYRREVTASSPLGADF